MKKLTLGLLPLLALVAACGEGSGTAARAMPDPIQVPGPSGPNGEQSQQQEAVFPGEVPDGGNGTGGGTNGPGGGNGGGNFNCPQICADLGDTDPDCVSDCQEACPVATDPCQVCLCSGAGLDSCGSLCGI